MAEVSTVRAERSGWGLLPCIARPLFTLGKLGYHLDLELKAR